MVKIINAAILNLVEIDDAVTTEIEESNAFKGEIYSVMVKINEFLSLDKTATPATRPSGSSGATAHNPVRLPKLVIQPFSGELTK